MFKLTTGYSIVKNDSKFCDKFVSSPIKGLSIETDGYGISLGNDDGFLWSFIDLEKIKNFSLKLTINVVNRGSLEVKV